MTSRKPCQGEAGCFLWLQRKTASKSEKTGQLSQKNNSREERRGEGRGGEGGIWDFTPQIYSRSFFGTLYCVIFSLVEDENRVWLFFFRSLWISGFVGGNAQQPSVCLARKKKSISASDKSLVYGPAWLLSGARRPGTADWVDCFSCVCSQMPPESPTPTGPDYTEGKGNKYISLFRPQGTQTVCFCFLSLCFHAEIRF